MNLNNIKNLLYMNLIYSVPPSSIEKYRLKQKKKKINLRAVILRQHLFLAFSYIIIFGIGVLTLNGDEARFLTFVSVFSIFSVLQAILAIFNVFYESNDLEACRPLPFTDLEVFVAKMAVCTLNIVYFLAPIVLYCFFIQFSFPKPIYFSIIFGIFSTLVLVSAVMLTAINITYYLTKMPVFKRSKKIATSALSGVILLGTILMVVAMSSPKVMENQGITNIAKDFPLFWMYYGIAKNPADIRTLIHIALWLLFVVVQLLIALKIVVPNIYKEASTMKNMISSRKKKKLQKYGSSLKSSLLHYHLGFLSDSQVFISFILMPPLIYMVMVIPNILLVPDEIKHSFVTPNYIIVAFIVGFFYALLSVGALSSIIISLDRENYNFVKSMPFDLKGYIKYKIVFAYVVQLVFPIIAMLILSIIIKAAWYLIAVMMLTYVTTAIPLSLRGTRKDHENLLLDWTNVITLAQRGGAKAIMMLKVIGVFFAAILLVILSITFAQKACFTSVFVITLLLYLLLIIAVGTSYTKTRKYFENNL